MEPKDAEATNECADPKEGASRDSLSLFTWELILLLRTEEMDMDEWTDEQEPLDIGVS